MAYILHSKTSREQVVDLPVLNDIDLSIGAGRYPSMKAFKKNAAEFHIYSSYFVLLPVIILMINLCFYCSDSSIFLYQIHNIFHNTANRADVFPGCRCCMPKKAQKLAQVVGMLVLQSRFFDLSERCIVTLACVFRCGHDQLAPQERYRTIECRYFCSPSSFRRIGNRMFLDCLQKASRIVDIRPMLRVRSSVSP